MSLTDERVREILSTMTSHPAPEMLPAHETKCLVLDDYQWIVYKKHLARVAKERKQTKPTVEKKKKVRDRRDTNFEAIELTSDPVVRICDVTFYMKTFESVDDVTDDKTYKSHVTKALRGEIDRFDGYFWIQGRIKH
ncbi:hypothetical protein PBCVFr5L_030R [Paramecium bursaria Chlorella virus Fr5L]|nr:hypothetical protein PBCVFr5L_030R [Paramecium bursaria Chlorella virus Fr5L]AGE56234.1 hypothetical protein PBCVNEJV1_240R [Paramecium bursaria Chlorella virus NE-JV-1]